MTDERKFDQNKHYKFVLHECPWCKSNLTKPENDGYVWRQKKVLIKCSDKTCIFNDSIPVVLWEEEVFARKPSLILATVDNFAKLTWEDAALRTFSNEKYSPPDLIIQDELHLISGPLGSLVGLYENVVLKLLSSGQKTPKIVGASATLTFSDTQTKSLYRGRRSNVFPPQILDWGDSFFAKESIDKPGRIYMGYFGSSRGSMVEASKKAVTPLLQSAQQNLPVLIKRGVKGSSSLFVNIAGPLEEGTKFTIQHKDNDNCEYFVEELREVDNGYEIVLDKPIMHDIELGNKDDAIQFIEIEEDNHRDPYGTLIWYFNSKRELASESNQINRLGDILREDTTKINYGRLGSRDKPGRFKRQIKQFRELTGRLSQDEIQSIVKDLNVSWRQYDNPDVFFRGIDILFATNMISVGIDISRLGLMAIHGQPRTTAEYIQATSRVGRQYPGLAVIIYNHTKSKDRSIYESFKNYHQSFYRFVESVSVTPFSSGARRKGLAAIFIALVRAQGKSQPGLVEDDTEILNSAVEWILDAVQEVDPEEYQETKDELEKIINQWKRRQPEEWGKMGGRPNDQVRLLASNSSLSSDLKVFSAPISLRSSDYQVQTRLYDPYIEEDNDQ